MSHQPAANRYDAVPTGWFRRCGRSGLLLPAISLGMWHNFGAPGTDSLHSADEKAIDENTRRMCYDAFDLGITHFDLANNYGPPPGSAEERTGKIIKDLPRDELIISTKAGYRMWPGPYGEWGSRKYLLASLDQSLKRLQLDYVDIFYSHRPDPDVGGTPLEETLGALDTAVRQGKALYAGISSYNGEQTARCVEAVFERGWAPITIHQPMYSMLNRWIEGDLLPVTGAAGVGVIAFCPLQMGLLTDKYLHGIPRDSRAGTQAGFLRPGSVTEAVVGKVRRLNDHAKRRGQSLAQMALAWTLRDPRVTSALIGASRPKQIHENVAAMKNAAFTLDEQALIDAILA